MKIDTQKLTMIFNLRIFKNKENMLWSTNVFPASYNRVKLSFNANFLIMHKYIKYKL